MTEWSQFATIFFKFIWHVVREKLFFYFFIRTFFKYIFLVCFSIPFINVFFLYCYFLFLQHFMLDQRVLALSLFRGVIPKEGSFVPLHFRDTMTQWCLWTMKEHKPNMEELTSQSDLQTALSWLFYWLLMWDKIVIQLVCRLQIWLDLLTCYHHWLKRAKKSAIKVRRPEFESWPGFFYAEFP